MMCTHECNVFTIKSYSRRPVSRVNFFLIKKQSFSERNSLPSVDLGGSLPLHKVQALASVPTQVEPVCTLPPCFFKVHFNTLPSAPTSGMRFLPFMVSSHSFVCVTYLPLSATCPAHLMFLNLIILIITGDE